MMKHCSSSQTGASDKKAKKHKTEYDLRWNREFPWHAPLYTEDDNAERDVIGLLCSICQCHSSKQRNRVGPSTEKPCTQDRSFDNK